jgi:PleD family two-component response regulator
MMIAEHDFPQLGQVTASIGFVEVVGQISPSDVIGQADEALYYAKQHGRNQVQSYQQLTAAGLIKHASQVAHGDVELF